MESSPTTDEVVRLIILLTPKNIRGNTALGLRSEFYEYAINSESKGDDW